jgi:hypothetical protein
LQLPINLKPKKAADKVRTVFLEKGNEPVTTDDKVDVVLGPSLYWFREKVLPAKSVSAAKKLAPSVFDAIVPPGTYSYFVIRRNDESYWLFAYDEAAIAEAVKHAGLRGNTIRNLYFAQTECLPLTRPLRVGGGKVLAEVDGVVTLLPAGYAAETAELTEYFGTRTRSEYRIAINLYRNDLLDKKAVKSLTIVAAVFAVIYGANYLMARQQLAAVQAKQETISRTYRLPQTSFERNGLINALEKKQRRQVLLREKAKAVFSLDPGKGSHLKSLTLSPQKISLSVMLGDEKDAEVLKKRLASFMQVGSEKRNGKTLTVEGTYE